MLFAVDNYLWGNTAENNILSLCLLGQKMINKTETYGIKLF